jgi:hypothetical protein
VRHRDAFWSTIAVVVGEKDGFDEARLMENCAHNRGLVVTVTLEFEDAIDWPMQAEMIASG